MPVVLVGESPDELVVLKPSGLACELPRDQEADSLVRRLEAQGWRDLRLVHRLDAAACGLVLVARSRAAAAYYSSEIAARRWRKLYVACVAAPPRSAATLVGPHTAYLKVEGRRARVVRAGGKSSFLEVLAAAPAPGSDAASHLLIALHSGRFHQIRAMLAHLGAPLCGDVRYGGPPEGPFYLEHALLGAYACAGGGWRVWAAPPHPDRDPWNPTLTAALQTAAGAVI